MSTRINLLPWREIRRRERDRQVFGAAIACWILAAVVVAFGYTHMNSEIDYQNSRNNFLQTRIAELDRQIREIEDIRARRAALIARMEVIQQLQRDRTQIVHLFDDLVRKLPDGVYLSNLSKRGTRITLQGVAQSNARVSDLMRNLDQSQWFANPDLNIINVSPRDGVRVSRFTLNVNQRAPATGDDDGDPLADVGGS